MNKGLLKLVFFLSFVPLIGLAHLNPIKGKYEKSKTINKEFNVNSNALLSINNKYGNIDVVSWDENRVVIEVKITINGNNESKVIERLKEIDVDFTNSSSQVTAKTTFGNKSSWSGWKNNSNIQYQIDYKVKMPLNNQADFKNDYGSISLNELKGKAVINCDYGKIIIGSLLHEQNSINIDYTNSSTIEFMSGGRINADYSTLTVEKAKNINLNADYSTLVFENLENLSFNCDYGKIQVDHGNNISGNSDYLSMRFGTIYKNLSVEADYGSLRIEKLMNGFENVKIDTDYTGIKIGLDPGASFNFVADLKYAGFSFEGNNVNYNKKIVKNTSKYYEGYVNKENSSSNIEISTDYGSVKFYNN